MFKKFGRDMIWNSIKFFFFSYGVKHYPLHITKVIDVK
jgi:hypothetical protein